MKTDIWEVIAEIGIDLHPDRVNEIAKKIAGLTSINDFKKVISCLGSTGNKAFIEALERAWEENPCISSLEIASALRSASATSSIMERREEVEMVWTGPFTGLVASRHTEQVLLQVINSAKSRLFIVSFVSYDIESVRKALICAADRDVKISILLESSKTHGGKITVDSIDAFRKTVPAANVYAWTSESKATDFMNGAVHAKCAVSDGSLAFITSANLTRAAMENNMELGVLIRGGDLPEKLERHLQALVVTGVIEKI